MEEKLIKDLQYRKGLGIAWFNAINSAVSLMGTMTASTDPDSYKQRLSEIRDWLLEEYKTYYATVIAQVGATYNEAETIARVNSAASMEELKSIWLSLSEDERRDGHILKAKNAMKKKYEKA